MDVQTKRVRDDFWADTDTLTLVELLDSADIFGTPDVDQFVITIRTELARRSVHPPTRLRVVR